jgi:hypothetical protein
MRTLYTAWIPSFSKDIFISELTTRQQKELIKSINSPFTYEFTRNVYNLLQEVIQTPIEINKLTLLDKFVILLRLRAVSVSDSIKYEFSCPKCKKEVKAQIELTPIINTINHLKFPFGFANIHEQYIVSGDIPDIVTELAFEETNTEPLPTNQGELYGEILIRNVAYFIKELTIASLHEKTKIIDFTTIPFLARHQLVEKLPTKLLHSVWEQIKNIQNTIETVQLLRVTCLCGEEITDTKLSLTTPIYSSFLKSIFNENLHNIYQNIYYMTSVMKFTPEYVEGLTPGEREIFWGYYNRDAKERQTKGSGELPVDKRD